MKKIGLTGGIGVGKTYVSEVFHKLKVPVFNADIKAKECLNNDKNLIVAVKQYFGENIYNRDGLRREILADIVFNDVQALKKLNSIVHPFVYEKFISWCSNQNSNIVIKEAAILFESKSHLELDAIICVSADKKNRITRIQERDGLILEDIQKRMNYQMSQKKKEKLSDFIIYNNGKELILPQVLYILKKII